jgi:N-acetylneuraminic acid mutarotase
VPGISACIRQTDFHVAVSGRYPTLRIFCAAHKTIKREEFYMKMHDCFSVVSKGAVAVFCVVCTTSVFATPVEVDWKAGETAPAKVARPFAGFLPDGRFIVAGGSYFEGGKKMYSADINVREQDGKWSKVGELPRPVAEGVCCETLKGIFCAGGTDGQTKFAEAFLLNVENGAAHVSSLPSLPEPLSMGAAAADGEKVYVVASKKVWSLDVAKALDPDPAVRKFGEWVRVGEIPGPARAQHIAAIRKYGPTPIHRRTFIRKFV